MKISNYERVLAARSSFCFWVCMIQEPLLLLPSYFKKTLAIHIERE